MARVGAAVAHFNWLIHFTHEHPLLPYLKYIGVHQEVCN
uniref:Uncharacterized protein n=1 Tax=Anguilla anguilla TaxID=7936 RepID=A0A0E9TUV1_ANGAN